jgi:hypothetical protein
MKKGFWKYFTVLSVLFAVMFFLISLMKIVPFNAIVIALYVIAIIGLVKHMSLKENLKDSSGDEMSQKMSEQPIDPRTLSMEQSLKKVIELYLECKLNRIDTVIVAELAGIIEKLFEILPRLNSEHPGTELTYVVNKICDEYLHQIVGTYLKLSRESQDAQKGEVVNVLRGLKTEIIDIYGLIESKSVGDFKTHAKFVRNKFFGETVEAS